MERERGRYKLSDTTFNFIGKAFNVTWAREKVADRGKPDGTVKIEHFKGFAGIIHDDGPEAIEAADLNEPIILAMIPYDEESAKEVGNTHFHFAIDGWDQIKKALRDGVEALPCYGLDEEDSLDITLI